MEWQKKYRGTVVGTRPPATGAEEGRPWSAQKRRRGNETRAAMFPLMPRERCPASALSSTDKI